MSDTAAGLDHAESKIVDLAAFRRTRLTRAMRERVKSAPIALAGTTSYHEAAICEEDRTRRT